ncbi:MAG TPA: tRNA lysidine(34) synthetase TilS [Candidatus Krumholzibacteria bacterium]|nr:tRNA lysidine(34) synthetase TilS [Candidatus Krumholzibacteria bacterium]
MILPLEHPVERALVASALLPRDGVVLVAVSGGADSMALVDALRAVVQPVVAHFDHRLREDSAHDAEHVAAYARAHGLEFVLGSEDVARRARAERASIEEAARNARYQFLTATAKHLGASCIATAHTQTDQVETVLMRILRGAGRVGLAGIPARRGSFVRPLLGITRADTRDYCASRGVVFVDDPTNEDVQFARNRVRHQILPELRAMFPSIDDALLRIAEGARGEQRAFEARTDVRRVVREEESGVWVLGLDAFEALDDDDATALLRDALAHAGLAHDVGRVHYQRLLELVRSTHAGSSVDLPRVRARREHDAIVLRPREAASERPAALLTIPGRTRAGDWLIETSFIDAAAARRELAGASRDATTAYFDADAVSTRLVARAPREGDRMRPFGLDGRKKLSDLFVDRKVPRRARERALVVEGETIHWVPGVATSDDGRVLPETARVVRMKATRA